jgi:serine/threonine protein kinase
VPGPEDEDVGSAPLGVPHERYRWLREINRGGMGVILGARDPVIGRKVAIKVLRPELEGDARVLDDFAQEACVTGQLDHPNIVPIYDFAQGEQSPFLVMKWISGKTLAELLRVERRNSGQPDRLRYLVQIVLRLCDALCFAHGRGVIHCDLKPANVMVGDHGQVYLMDWGMALVKSSQYPAPAEPALEPGARPALESSATALDPSADAHDSFVRAPGRRVEPGQARGTPAYMAREQQFGLIEEIDERTDVFGLGGILCEILVGQPPNNQRIFGGVLTPNRTSTAPIRSPLWHQLPPELCRITAKALAAKRAERYASVSELRAELEQFLRGGGWFETRVFAPGEAIVSEGEGGDTAYIIERGSCDVFKLIDGQERWLRRLSAGAVFGEMAVFTGGRRSATVKAVDEVSVKLITGASLNLELDQNPWVAAFVRSLALLVRDNEDRASRPPASEAQPNASEAQPSSPST